jgi:hypothetical protein
MVGGAETGNIFGGAVGSTVLGMGHLKGGSL